ncbi:MerR family transcriptional regulator [Faecalicatena fissicatena]|uniref:MerR family transcriptional regulator n=1 Tax=Faecalicatena fissicatena TaxID=290055 RepID=A0ABS2ECI5_9FIRM|nr:MerR family transcriptional regulator [Faecalicatena fissicatena]MBM6739255.1 MerR family transcriptional regulator [Faecalicatena fissicatena]HIX99863.1 MerR family transcriptional regulator [Candidatus Dorea intestinigallinarum]
MTIDEVSRCCGIPLKVLQEYDNADPERLSVLITLHQIGFESAEIEAYMKLLEKEDSDGQRLRILERKRRRLLDEIHFQEKQLSQLDYLRYSIRKKQSKKTTI